MPKASRKTWKVESQQTRDLVIDEYVRQGHQQLRIEKEIQNIRQEQKRERRKYHLLIRQMNEHLEYLQHIKQIYLHFVQTGRHLDWATSNFLMEWTKLYEGEFMKRTGYVNERERLMQLFQTRKETLFGLDQGKDYDSLQWSDWEQYYRQAENSMEGYLNVRQEWAKWS